MSIGVLLLNGVSCNTILASGAAETEGADIASAHAQTKGEEAGLGRPFYLYASGRAVSVLGDRVALIALIFLVIGVSHGYAPALGLFYICRVLPALVCGLIAGVLVDHFDRRRLMIGCDLGRAVLVGLVPVLISVRIWLLFPLVVVLFGLTYIFDTAARAAIPDVVPEVSMTLANSILNGIDTAADFFYAIGGIMVVALPRDVPFYVDAATFVVSAGVVAALRFPAMERGPLPDLAEVIQRIHRGIQFLAGQSFLKWSTVAFAFAPFAGGIAYVVAPLYANTTLGHGPGLAGPLHGGAFRFSILEVALGMGALAGSVLMTRLSARLPRGQIFGMGMAGSGVADCLLGLTSNFYGALVIMVVSGAFNSMFVIAGLTLVQGLTPSTMRGRVLAARTTVVNASLALGSAAAGVLLISLSYRALWFISGAIILYASLFIWLRPDVRSQR